MNIRIRHAKPADAAALARVHVDSWRTTYAGIVPQEYLSSLSCSSSQATWNETLETIGNKTSLLVAEAHEDKVIGFAHCGPERAGDGAYQGEIYSLYLLEEFQRKGLGRRLFLAVTKRLLDDGMSSMLLWVFEANLGARQFYESLGGENTSRSAVIKIAGSDLVEIAYGWTDIAPLVR